MKLWPFFTFYGGKWRAAPHYPRPQHETIVEPFAGSAGYAVRNFNHEVILYDVDPVIVGVWQYLISVSSEEIMRLPLDVPHVDEIDVCQEAKWLIGFWLNKGCAAPMKSPSSWMRQGLRPNSQWGEAIRGRIATQVPFIRHWRVDQISYADAPDREATWFIDPPYSNSAGRHYRYSDVDYDALATWCRSRSGQVIVCANEGESWLPFRPFREIKSTEGAHGKGKSREAIWLGAAA